MKAVADAAAPAADRGTRPVTALRGVGAALAERLERLGVTRVADLLFVLPLRYEDRTRVSPIGQLSVGQRAAVEGEVLLTEVTYRRRRQLLCRICDGSGMLTLRFFYFSGAQQANLARGTRLRCFGEVRRGPLGLEIVHPEYRRVGKDAAPLEENLTPIYPLTDGVPQGRLRILIGEALRELERAALPDWIPQRGRPARRTALAGQRGDLPAPAAARGAASGAGLRQTPGAAAPRLRGTAGASPRAARCANAHRRPIRRGR